MAQIYIWVAFDKLPGAVSLKTIFAFSFKILKCPCKFLQNLTDLAKVGRIKGLPSSSAYNTYQG